MSMVDLCLVIEKGDLFMATRQYIGARYVPKFYDYNGSSNWRSGVEYEALTIVTRNGNSYTSKIPVPSSVGAPEENPTYWVATGLYNEQVEAYRQLTIAVASRVDDAEGDIDALDGRMDSAEDRLDGIDTSIGSLEDSIEALDGRMGSAEDRLDEIESVKKWVFLSDSYGTTAGNASGETETIYTYLRTLSGRDTNNLIGWSVPGGGFLAEGAGSFNGYVVDHYSEISDRDSVEKFVVIAGRNDHTGDTATILGKMRQFYATVKEYFPNAKVYCGFIANGTNSGHGTRVAQMSAYFAYLRCQEANMIYLNGVENALCMNEWLSEDQVHPTLQGKKQIAYGVWNAIETGGASVHAQSSQTVSPATGISFVSSAPTINATVFNNLCNIAVSTQFTFTLPSTSFTRNAETILTIGTISTISGIVLAPYGSIYFEADAIFNSEGTYIKNRVRVRINSDGQLQLVIYPDVALPNITAIGVYLPSVAVTSTIVVR